MLCATTEKPNLYEHDMSEYGVLTLHNTSTHQFRTLPYREEVGKTFDVDDGVDDVARLAAHDGGQLLQRGRELNLVETETDNQFQYFWCVFE